jgi:hypothetical protein
MYYFWMFVFVVCVFVESFLVYRAREKTLPEWVDWIICIFIMIMPMIVIPMKEFFEKDPHVEGVFLTFVFLCIAALIGGIEVAYRTIKKKKV